MTSDKELGFVLQPIRREREAREPKHAASEMTTVQGARETSWHKWFEGGN